MLTQLQKLLMTVFLLQCSFAVEARFFSGLQLGETDSNYNAHRAGLLQVDARNLGFSGRVYAGYQFNQMIGVEAGYLHFHDTRLLRMNNTLQNGTIAQISVDVMVRANLPLKSGLSILGKFGGAYLQAVPSANLRALSTNDFSNGKVAHFRPVFGVGMNYEINPSWSIDASWLHILKHRALPYGTLIAIGTSYSFAV